MRWFKTRRQRAALRSIRRVEGEHRRNLQTPGLSTNELHGSGWKLFLARRSGIEAGLTRQQVGFTL